MKTTTPTILYLYKGGFHAVRHRMSGIFRFACEHGWHLCHLEVSDMRGSLAHAMTYWNAQGVIIEGELATRASIRDFVEANNLPVVWCDVDAEALTKPHFAVMHDSRHTAAVVVRKLLSREYCASYGFVTAGIRCEWSDLRKQTFLEMMEAAGKRTSVFDLVAASRGPTAEICYCRLGEWLAGLPRPCGIFAANDETGEFVLTAARRFGLDVPQDVAVIGIDNDDIICEYTIPTLASVSPNFEESGYLAAQLLKKQIDKPKAKPETVAYGSGELVLRTSIRQFAAVDHAVLKAVEFIRLNACREISVPEIAAVMKTGRRSAEIRFRRQTGHSFQDEIDEVRFRTACELLQKGTVPLKNLHQHCGYASARALRNLFLKKCGKTPTAWRAAQEGK